jgi:hypothetical protein
MRNDLCLLFRRVVIIVLISVSTASSSRAVCYTTPRAAVDALATTSSFSVGMKNNGYQVARIVPDPVLHQKWAMIIRCGHPDLPAFAVPANEARSFAATPAAVGVSTALMVRAGEMVRLWGQESLLRFETSGVAEESGELGSTIRVRLAHHDADDQSTPKWFSGIIRGNSDVEIQP